MCHILNCDAFTKMFFIIWNSQWYTNLENWYLSDVCVLSRWKLQGKKRPCFTIPKDWASQSHLLMVSKGLTGWQAVNLYLIILIPNDQNVRKSYWYIKKEFSLFSNNSILNCSRNTRDTNVCMFVSVCWLQVSRFVA